MSRAAEILARLDTAYPGATIELAFSTPLELLVATILSAQCTDERVNAVTAELFKRYRSAEDYARADPAVLEREIHSTGFFKAKARSLIGMGRALVERHGGVVPATAEDARGAARGRPQDGPRGARQCLRQSPRSPWTPTSSACPSASGSPGPTTPRRSTTSSVR